MLRWYWVRFKRGFVAQVLGFDRTLWAVVSGLGVPVSTLVGASWVVVGVTATRCGKGASGRLPGFDAPQSGRLRWLLELFCPVVSLNAQSQLCVHGYLLADVWVLVLGRWPPTLVDDKSCDC